MQGLILAAGQGKRLGSEIPKALLEINGETLIHRTVGMLRQNGVENIILITGYKREYLMKAIDKLGISVVHNKSFENSENLVSFKYGLSKLKDNFILAHCDLVFEEELLKRVIKSPAEIVLPFDRKSADKESMKIKFDKDTLLGISKDFKVTRNTAESIPLMKFSAKTIPHFNEIVEKFMYQGEFGLYFESALMQLIHLNLFKLECVDATGLKWVEIDTPEDYRRAGEIFRE